LTSDVRKEISEKRVHFNEQSMKVLKEYEHRKEEYR
jgi:hypothetical protein